MTSPLGGDSLGDAFVNVHADTEGFEKDVKDGLEDAGKDAKPAAAKAGKEVGDALGDGVEKEVSRRGPGIAKTIGKSVEKEVIDVTPNFRWNTRGKDGRFIGRAASGIKEEVEEAFSAAGDASSSVFSRIGQGIADAIGAGFNVSGKSPLVYILAPVYAALAGLVIAAIQAANGVVAAILAIPAAISVLLVEVGVLYLAFHGLGEAIQGAFAATNATELNEALKNLTPSAQSFVRALLPAKSLFDSLAKSAQESFFSAFGGGERITALIEAISKPLKAGIPIVAQALGDFFEKLALFFASPLFGKFLDQIFPAVAQIIDMLSGPFIQFLVGLFVLIVQSLPFLLNLTARFGDLLRLVGDLLAGVSPTWLNDMLATLDATFELLGAVIGLIAVVMAQVNSAGGKDLIEFLTEAVTVLTNFFATTAGKEAIAGLIRLAEVGIFLVVDLIFVISLFLAGFQLLTNTIATFAGWLLNTAWPAIKSFFTSFHDTAGTMVTDIGAAISTALTDVGTFITTGVAGFLTAMRTGFTTAVKEVAGLPGRIQTALGDLRTTLVQAGRNLLNGLMDGIRQVIPNLRSFLTTQVTNLLPSWKGPESKDRKLLEPAGRAVMEGFGAGITAGAADIKSMLGDFTTGLGGIGVSNNSTHILFGAGAMNLNFKGALPTSDEAMATGQAVGAGINSQLAARNTRLAVRTL